MNIEEFKIWKLKQYNKQIIEKGRKNPLFSSLIESEEERKQKKENHEKGIEIDGLVFECLRSHFLNYIKTPTAHLDCNNVNIIMNQYYHSLNINYLHSQPCSSLHGCTYRSFRPFQKVRNIHAKTTRSEDIIQVSGNIYVCEKHITVHDCGENDKSCDSVIQSEKFGTLVCSKTGRIKANALVFYDGENCGHNNKKFKKCLESSVDNALGIFNEYEGSMNGDEHQDEKNLKMTTLMINGNNSSSSSSHLNNQKNDLFRDRHDPLSVIQNRHYSLIKEFKKNGGKITFKDNSEISKKINLISSSSSSSSITKMNQQLTKRKNHKKTKEEKIANNVYSFIDFLFDVGEIMRDILVTIEPKEYHIEIKKYAQSEWKKIKKYNKQYEKKRKNSLLTTKKTSSTHSVLKLNNSVIKRKELFSKKGKHKKKHFIIKREDFLRRDFHLRKIVTENLIDGHQRLCKWLPLWNRESGLIWNIDNCQRKEIVSKICQLVKLTDFIGENEEHTGRKADIVENIFYGSCLYCLVLGVKTKLFLYRKKQSTTTNGDSTKREKYFFSLNYPEENGELVFEDSYVIVKNLNEEIFIADNILLFLDEKIHVSILDEQYEQIKKAIGNKLFSLFFSTLDNDFYLEQLNTKMKILNKWRIL